MNLTLKNQIALVTGASRGIGQGILRELAELGAYVVGTATTGTGAEAISAFLKQHDLQGHGVALDVTDPDAIAQSLAAIREQAGAATILVNNAGITRDNLMLRMKDEEWEDIMAVNLSAVFRLTKACLRPMIKARWGRIINIGSVVGTMGNPGQVNYAAAKAGLLGFSKSLAREVAERQITVNVVSPGFIDTDMTRALADSQREAIMSSIPMHRLGQVQDVASMVAFLASESGNYLTGQTFHVNGGMIMD